MLTIQLMTLSGKFQTLRCEQVTDMKAALALVTAHAASGGFTNVKTVWDVDSVRFTAKTPGGRGGRNVAFADILEGM